MWEKGIVAYFIYMNLSGDAKETMQTVGEAGSDLYKFHIGVRNLLINHNRGTEVSLRYSLHIQTFK
jgi:hypothetical protein